MKLSCQVWSFICPRRVTNLNLSEIQSVESELHSAPLRPPASSAIKHNSINLSQDFWLLKSTLSKQLLTFGATNAQSCQSTPLMLSVNQQLVSKEWVKFMNYQMNWSCGDWSDDLYVFIIRRWQCAPRVLHSHHALSWLFKWQRWSICTLAISMSKSICLPRFRDLEAHSLLVQAGRRAR